MATNDDMVRAIREAIAPMWHDTQGRISNLHDTLRNDIENAGARLSRRVDSARAATEASLQAVETRLAEVIESID